MLLITVRKVTPTSANTASQIGAKPKIPKLKTINLTIKEKIKLK